MKIHKAGWPFVGGAGLLFVGLVWMAVRIQNEPLALLSGVVLLLALFCAYFFRDPARVIPKGDRLVLSPADGKILEIVEETDKATGQKMWMIRIFLSVFDPHIQRAPVQGTIRRIQYKKGKFLDARNPQAPFENERNLFEISPAGGHIPGPIYVTQIAGLIARRIVWWVKESQVVSAGEQFGLIRFGSQVDIAMPQSLKLRVKKGDILEAGSSILADMPQKMG